jgi:molybdopterin/thiamine biosynthesis adenylyltransferase
MRRLAHDIDPIISVVEVRHRTSDPEGIRALRQADVVVSCVDRFDARSQINALARRHLQPLVDIGITLRSSGETLTTATGQVVLCLPGEACLRCSPLLSDAVIERERRIAPPGYDQTPDAPGEPQVVSMNGLLASQAVTLVLAVLTGYLPAELLASGGWWQYDALEGQLDFSPLAQRRLSCPGCTEEGHGDPWF